MVTPFDKALAAFIVAVVVLLGQNFHLFTLTPDQIVLLTGVVGGAVVYLVPNKK